MQAKAVRATFSIVVCGAICCSAPVAWGQTSVRTSGLGPQAFIFDGRLTPFVTEIIPVVGSPPPMVLESPLKNRLRMAGGLQGLRPPLRLPEAAEESSGRAAYEGKGEEDRAVAAIPERRSAEGSSAERGDLSVSAIRRQQAADDLLLQAELDRLVAEALRQEAAGNRRAAALAYSKAAAKVEDQRREAFLTKARQLRR